MLPSPEHELAQSVERYADDAVSRLYDRVWCGRVHFGLWRGADDTVAEAAGRVPMTMASEAAVSAGDLVLEVGSGAAAAAVDLARATGCRVVASNHSPAHAALAEKAVSRAGVGDRVNTAIADAQNLPFPDAQFSVYWAQEVLVHMTDKDRAFSEALRVLEPGGRIVFSEQTSRAATMTAEERRLVSERHGSVDLWDSGQFVCALHRAGFASVRTLDWSAHLSRHFEALLERVDEHRVRLDVECGTGVVEDNRAAWARGAAYARAGKIGWHLFVGEKR